MTLRDSSVRNGTRKADRRYGARLRDKRRRKDRRLLSETLEQRQLLAGPELVGIQPNDGALIRGGETLNVSPRELVFRFDDQSDLDPLTVASGISITRAGADRGFESATATTDLGTGGLALLEFRATESGARGNGIEIRLRASDRGTASQVVNVTVNEADRVVTLDLNSNSGRPSVVRDVITAVQNSAAASALVEVDQISGPSLLPVGPSIGSGIDVVLNGANAAQFVTDLGTGGQARARFISTTAGPDGVGTTISVSRANLNLVPGQLPFVTVSNNNIQVILDSTPGRESTVNDMIAAINSDPDASSLVFGQLELGNGNAIITNTTFAPLTLVGATDTVVEPGFVGLGDTPHEVVFRFAEALPEDTYQVEIFGNGPLALRNLDGEAFSDGTDFGVQFSVNNAPQVAAVVPTPVRRLANGMLSPELNVIEVHFSENVANANSPLLYELVYTRDTVSNLDDVTIHPSAVTYSSVTRVARLEFPSALSRQRDPLDQTQFLGGSARLRIGSDRPIPDAPAEIIVNADPADTFTGALNLGAANLNSTPGAIESLRLDGEIDNPTDYSLQFPGGTEFPGVRNIRPDDPSRRDRTVPLDVWRRDGDNEDGISTVYYDFKPTWRGDDPNRGVATEPDLDQLYFNLITDEQKQRVREVLSLYSEYLGVQFVEINAAVNGIPTDPVGRYIAIAVGELAGADGTESSRVGGVTVATRPLDALGQTGIDPALLDTGNELLVMDFQDFDASVDDQLGGEFFRGAFLGVGQLLGYGYADHLPQPVTQSTQFVLNPGDENEPLFPSPSDIVNGQYLYRPESNDVDLYRFTLNRPGTINIQTVAERLSNASSLDTNLRLYERIGVDGTGREQWREIATNDDYFSNDSLIELELPANQYVVGVSASGNSVYDPTISGTGIGGLTEGEYELRITFEADGASVIVDQTQLALDGDLDGRAGGEFDFWFVPSDPVNTIYVDKAYTGARSGSLGVASNPYSEIDSALTVAANRVTEDPLTGRLLKQQVRVVGGGEYQIGLDNRALALPDGATLDVPKGVQLIVDAGSTFLMRRSRIGVGSTTDAPLSDRSQSSIQVLGTPSSNVVFRSFNSVPDFADDNLAGTTVSFGYRFTAIDPTTNGQTRLFRVDSSSFTFGDSFVFPATGLTRLGSDPANGGDWGGIDIRGDIDAQDASRINPEEFGVFLNHIQYADIRHGGGAVSVDGRQVVVSPIELAVTRATVINSRISESADAAIAATPDTFAETRFDEERFQREAVFTPDVERIGPHIRGNEIVDNTINGLFIRIQTRTGENLERLNVTARADDTDIVHVLSENLLIEGEPGGPNSGVLPPSTNLVRSGFTAATGSVPQGNYVYRLTFVNRNGYETTPSAATNLAFTPNLNGAIQLIGLPSVPVDSGFTGRRLYRAQVDLSGNPIEPFRQVASLNTNSTTYIDRAAAGTVPIVPDDVRLGRIDPSLTIDPGSVFKFNGSRIDVILDGHIYAEGTESLPIVMTSLSDDRYGAGGSFDTSSTDGQTAVLKPGDWGGIYVAFGGVASIDHTTIAGGGGATRVQGGFGSFNPIEVHQGDLRVANSRFEQNADGRNFVNDPDDVRSGRVGRGDNASGTIFVRGAQPIILDNEFVDGTGPVLSFDVNSFTSAEQIDSGRSTGLVDAMVLNGNSGPLIQGNRVGTTRLNQLDPNDPENRNFACSDALGQNPLADQNGNLITCSLNGLEIRGGTVATEVVLDDVDMVHIVRDTIEIPNQHLFGGMRLQSDSRGSLVVKFQNQDNNELDTLNRRQAGIVAGGTLVTAEDEFIDIDDRIGGSLQVIGHPDFPVVLTALVDDTVGAGFTPDGRPNVDTDNNGLRLDEDGNPIVVLTSETNAGPPPPPLLPLGVQYDRTDREEVDNANLIDNDIDPQVIGFLEAEIEYGSQIEDDVRFTYLNENPADGPLGPLQLANVAFLYTTYIDVDVFFPFVNPAPLRLADTAANPPNPVLIGDDLVRSTGTFILDEVSIDPTAARNTAPNIPRRIVDWTAESFILNSRGTIYTRLDFETRDNGNFTDNIVSSVQVISYLDQGIDDDDEDILYSVGTPGQPDFRALTINRDAADRTLGPLIGFSHGGIYGDDNFNQINASYLGWAADDAMQLLNGIEQEVPTATYSVTGNINTQALTPSGDPIFDAVTPGTVARGEGDIGTAFAWQLANNQDEARVTTLVEFFPSDPVDPFRPTLPPAIDGAGTWDGVTIREAASDANVAITSESEPSNLGNILVNDTNPIPSQSQFLGELAPDLSSGDNNRRLGFIVDGTIAQKSDLDVYAFIGEAGTQVWLDIDRTNLRLDAVVELIDANGNVRILSDDSLSEARGDTNRLIGPGGFDASTARPLGTSLVPDGSPDSAYQDAYSTNPRDPGMRLILPGNVGQRFLYHVRVRSANDIVSGSSALTNASRVRGGLTTGAYQLQIRLDETDVFAGTQVRYSDVRFAVNGVQVIGGPNHSPILAEEYETQSPNDTIANAQRLGLYETLYDAPVVVGGAILDENGSPIPGLTLGLRDSLVYDRISGRNNGDDVTLQNPAGPLTSDRLAKSVAGILDGVSDVDWYQFDIGYEQISRDSAALYLSAVFDLDYADGAARADTAIYVFNEARELVMIGTDSNIADDQPPGDLDVTDLSRGSLGTGDPFIGSAELNEGTYYVAVSNQARVPVPLSQFFDVDTSNPLLRLEPVDSIRRIAEDRIYRGTPQGPIDDTNNYDIFGNLINPNAGTLIGQDGVLLDRFTGEPIIVNGQTVFAGGGTASPPEVPVLFGPESILDYSLDDVLLYVNTGNSLHVVNPFTGERYLPGSSLGSFGTMEFIRDVAFRANGELFGYTGNNPAGDASSEYVRIDTADASLTTIGTTGLQTFHLQNTAPTNLVLDIASNDGFQVEGITIREFLGQEDGFFIGNRPIDQLGLEYFENVLYDFDDATGMATGPTYDRSRFAPGAGTTPREVGQIDTEPPVGQFQTNQLGITDATEIGPNGVASPSLFDGDTFTLSNVTESVTFELEQGFTLIANGTQPVRDGDAVVIDGTIFEFNTGVRLSLSEVAPFGLLSEGQAVDVVGSDGTQRFQFVRFGQPQFGSIPISLVDASGNARSAAQIARDLAGEINAADIGVTAQSQAGEVFFSVAPVSLTASGVGVQVLGDAGLNNAGAVELAITGTTSPETLIATLAAAIRNEGIPVSSAGTQLALPSSISVTLQPDPTMSPSAFTLRGDLGVGAGNVAVRILPTDSAATLAERIAIAVQAANDAGDLPNVLAVPNGSGRSLNIISGFVDPVGTTGNFVAGGVATGGTVTGIELVNDQLYAVTNTGGLFQVSSFELATNGNRTIGRYVSTATDLIGINFTGLRAGPVSVENGAFSQVLFGITGSGNIYAFNTLGELQPIFAGGRSVISTGIGNAQGLDFSVVDFNLWHVTGQRGGDPGHGIDPLFNNTRLGSAGGSSLAFTYENAIFGGNYPAAVEQPTFAPRLDMTTFEDSYNVPGGAKGVVQSNSFSLKDYAAEDLPFLYFNYYMETEGVAGRDALRVYVVTNDGVEHLVATNGGGGEFVDPDPFTNPRYGIEDPTVPGGIRRDEIFTEVQRIFDTTNSVNDTWRQARVPLSEFAGREGLSLRVEFSTQGTTLTTSDALRVISGRALAEAGDLTFVLNDGIGVGEAFTVQLAPTITFPSGLQLANLYADPTEAAVITIDGQEYLLNVIDDPLISPRAVGPNQIEVDLLAGAPLGVTLSELSADDIAITVANIIQANPGPGQSGIGMLYIAPGNLNQTITGFNFSPEDTVPTQRNDLIFEATPLPYTGGNQTITGSGRLGTLNNPFPPTELDDVDLVRLEVTAGSLIEVDVDLAFNVALDAAIRFFDATGNELPGILNPANDTVQHTAQRDGAIFIGISGLGNETYDPRIEGSSQTGQIDSYTASVNVTLPSAFRTDGNLVEFVGGQNSFSATPSGLFFVTPRTQSIDAIDIPISRFMSASEVAAEVQRAIANRYTSGNNTAIPTRGPTIRLPGFSIVDSGPFGDEADRFASGGAGYRISPANNAFEGVYLDDFIIGFAERGEMATNANALSLIDPVDPNDPNDPNAQFIAGPQAGQPTNTGAYQLEIRDGSEYVISDRVQVNEPGLQFFAGQPIVVPISGVPFGIPLTSAVPVSSVLSANQNPFPEFDLPTIDIDVDAQGNPLFTRINENFFVTLASDGTLVQLIELGEDFTPVPSTFVPVPAEARFRTFDTNDRLASGFTVQALSGTNLVDGATFTIFDSLNELSFEFDIIQLANGLNDPTAIAIEVDAAWSAQEVASEIIRVLSSQNVQAVLDMDVTRSNTTTPPTLGELALPPGLRPRDFPDDRVNLYGNISFNEVTPGFASVTAFGQRGDSNRDRDEQGVIIIENSRFLFNSDSGVAITRDAEARVLSVDQRDEFPVALTYPANLIELNTEGLVPGVVVQNNVLAFNANNGLFIAGLDGGGGAINNPVGFDKIVNNTVIGGVVEPGLDLGAQIFAGFLFERGGISFADEVDRDSLNLGSDVDAAFTDTVAALSSPDCFGHGPEPADGQFTLSLGTGGQAVFRFTDNFLTGNDSPTPDLVIFEAGASETVRVEISRDGENYFFVGNASGLNNTIDIDQFGFDSFDRFAFVRLTDLVSPLDEPTVAFGAAGADIDAIGALSTVPANVFTPGAQGIVVTQNAGPTLLNNIVANLQTGIAVTPPSNDPALNDIDVSRDRTVIGGSTYFRNAFDALGTDQQSLGLFGQLISDFEQIFVDATALVFTPMHDVRTIDSSIDSLEDRASLLTLRGAVGLPPVPIIAPSVDLNGQLRIDDPAVDTPPGVGLSVFKDRGAEDRADSVGPRLSLITPRADDLLNDSGRVVTVGTVFDSFDIQLIDGITPADPSSGVGVDDGSVLGALIRVKRLEAGTQNTETLVEGVDYRFAYEPADNIIRLTPIAGIWKDNSVYTVEFLGDDVGIVQGEDGVVYADGALTQIDLTAEDRRAIEVDTGIGISIAPSALSIDLGGAQVPNIEGQTLEVFDGRLPEPVIFELTTDNNNIDIIIASGNVPVRVGEAATAEQIASAVATAINQSTLQLYATSVGNRIQIRDSVVKATELFTVRGAAAYLGADVTLSPELRGVNIESGQQSLTVFDGTSQATFTLATNPAAVTTGIPVIVSPTARSAEIANALKNAIESTGLQVAASVDGSILKLRGLSDRVDAATAIATATSGSLTGNPLNDAFKLTNYQLDVQLTAAAINAVDGSTITIFDGEVERTFEFDNVAPPAGLPAVTPGNLTVPVGPNPTPREMLEALRDRVERTGLKVQIVNAARSFRITGTANPISVTSATGAVAVTGFGAIGSSPGFGIGIPSDGLDLSDTVDEGQFFVISRGVTSETFEIDFDGIRDVEGSTLVTASTRSLDAVANAIVAAINNSQFAITAQNIGGGRVTFTGVGSEDVNLDTRGTVLTQLGIAGLPTPTPVVVPLDGTPEEIGEAYSSAFDALSIPQELIGDRVIVQGLEAVRGTSVVSERISDEVGNLAFLGELVIFVGGGLDYGDAPSNRYASTAAQGGPRHTVDNSFALWRPDPTNPDDRPITPDSDAQVPDLDEDNGVRLTSGVQPGFSTTFEIAIHNPDNRQFFVDAWFDWDGNGTFETVQRFGSAGTGRSVLQNGINSISVPVPGFAALGESYARFRLSEDANLGSTGDASSGEVEDIRLVVSNNPFQNPTDIHDVNNNGVVSPLDALQIINALDRNRPNGDINLALTPLPVDLPIYPDVDGNGEVTAFDALLVINRLEEENALRELVGQGEAIGYVPTANGVLASGTTAIGDALISAAADDDEAPVDAPTVEASRAKTSVFDSPPVVALDADIEAIAEDTAASRDDDEHNALDQLFASL